MCDQIKSPLLLTLLLQLSFACNPTLYFNIGKSYYDIHYSPTRVSIITGNTLITM